MISSNARNGFDQLLKRALQSGLSASTEEICKVNVLRDTSDMRCTQMVILTIASYLFRLTVLIYFTPDDSTKNHFAKTNQIPAGEMSEQALHDSIAEFSNMCCGILNRELGGIFPHTGMSTPNVINGKSAEYLKMLGCGHIQHFKIEIGDLLRFDASIGVCDYGDLDFMVDVYEESVSTGELELF